MDSKNDKHLTVSCQICFKQMRSDNLKKHTEIKHGEPELRLVDELQKGKEKYHEMLENGYHIYNSIMSKEISQTSLSFKNDEALKLYMKHRPVMDVENVQLRPWQQEALKLFESPTDREVIWIRGQETGNEGKTWFQTYMQSHYGFQNVVLLDMKCRASNSLLWKLPLINVNMFLFNNVRSTSTATESCYNLMRMIKDGWAVSSK